MYIMNNNPNPFRNVAGNLFVNNNNNGRRRVAALERQNAMNIALLRRIIDEQNSLAPRTPTHRNKRARLD